MKNMLWKLLLTAAVAAALPAQARTIEQVKAGGKLVAATEGAYAPFNYFNAGKLAGFEVEVAEMVAKKMGVALEWKTVGFDALLTGLSQDRWDVVIASHGITEERAKAVTFTAPHYCSGPMVVAKQGGPKSPKDLAGKTVSVQTGTTYIDPLKKIGTLKDIRNFPTDPDARAALLAGRVDAWITERFTALEAGRKNPELKLQIGELLFTEKIAAATSKGNTGLAQAWNKALEASMADGSYAALSKKYFGEDVRCR
ncbi:ABC transporter substrate-binding protein [Ramlibacter sp.]|uniref:substrate-binding periplasmic protein n=1 Tax=Ramlibacter sp. TaxID=1917967 RepID=UPI0017F4938E|nr:ABC transporter substrate-binding protein [Ramlibacter sp.]MBA2675370.1 amino acid ABC transporter substrate-binding protein [Ramlibacter sp.]